MQMQAAEGRDLKVAGRRKGGWLDRVLLTVIAVAGVAAALMAGTLLVRASGGLVALLSTALFIRSWRIPPPELRDETSAVEIELQLRKRNVAITTALDHMSQGLCMFDGDKRLIVSNAQYGKMYGIEPRYLQPGTEFERILRHRIDNGSFKAGNPEDYIRERMASVEERASSVKVQQLTDGRSIAISHRPLPGGGWVATHDDITEIRRIEAQIAHMAHHDGLTDLPNRILFREELDRALLRARRGEQMWLLCLDLDHFKAVNDTLGHPMGDALLKAVAERLRGETRSCDVVCRLGGDEFAILQSGIDEPDQAKMLAERLIATLSMPYELEGHHIVIGTSIGIAVAPSDSDDADHLLKLADMALYRAKTEGRSTYRFFEPGMDAKMQARRALELDLRKALAAGEFEIHYQPLVNITEGRVSAFEALLRWHHPARGTIPPGEFIPIAEDIGVIGAIGAWVLKEACREAAGWPEEVRIAVNLSAAQFKSRELELDVLAALGQSGLAPQRLELEITETVMLQDMTATLETLHRLKALGVRISMDDFGTGYSSLSFLRRFPFDKIKIDRSFVQDLPNQAESLAIVKAVFGLSTSLGMATTAEGVETAEQLLQLREEGFVEVQGFLFSPARSARDVPGLLITIPGLASSAA